MNGSVKRVILGEAIVLVAWLVIMFVCKNALMNPIVFAMSLGFGVLAFAAASISAAMSDKQSTVKSTTEIHYLPVAVPTLSLPFWPTRTLCLRHMGGAAARFQSS